MDTNGEIMSSSRIAIYCTIAFVGVIGLVLAYNAVGAAGFLPLAIPVSILGKYASDNKKKAEELKKSVESLDKKYTELKKEGVSDLSTKEEVDYWKKQ
jgi:hypothetical protein